MNVPQVISLTQENGLVSRGLSWEIERPKGKIVIMEGMEEHTLRYDRFANFLNDNGFSVHALDAFGQGENVRDNPALVGLWPKDGFSHQVNAVHQLVQDLKQDGLPVYIFSHSMGSFMGQEYIQRFPGDVKKIVLCGSGSKNGMLGLGYMLSNMTTTEKNFNNKAKMIAKLMFGGFNKKIKNPKTEFDWLSYNEENVKKYIDDPLCGFGPTNGFCLEFIKGMRELHHKKRLKGIDKDQEIFLISGAEDPVTLYGKSVEINAKMYRKLGLEKVETKVYEHMRHEILNEDDYMKVQEDILAFFLK